MRILIARQGLFTPLYTNAMYLIVNSAAVALMGFVFWGLMAREFVVAAVGIGSALFAANGLISSLANLGLGNALVRFVPAMGEKDVRLVNSACLVSGVVAIAASVIYVAGVHLWSPGLYFLAAKHLLAIGFVIVTAAASISTVFDSAFVARRMARYVFWKTMVLTVVRIPLPIFIFFGLGGYGIFLGGGVAVLAAVTAGFLFFLPRTYPGYSPGLKPDLGLLRPVLPFSLTNYVASLLASAVGFIFPLMVLNIRGAEDTAYFTMVWLVASVVAVIPQGVSVSLLAECSHHPENLKRYVKRALQLSLALLVVAVGALYVLAPFLLRFFGDNYATGGSTVLRWLLPGNFAVAVSSFYNTVNQLQEKLAYIILQAFATTVLTIGLGYWLLGKMGLPGIGIGYTLGNFVVALAVAVPLWRAVGEVPRVLEEMEAGSEGWPSNQV